MAESTHAEPIDVAIVGGGAAGLATAIFAARSAPGLSIVILDGARKLGAKILVSGGGRCNVTNRSVTARDFHGGSPHVIKRVLAAFPVDRTVSFFGEIGVELHEEEHGKLFPDTNQARTVLDSLMNEASRRGVHILPEHRVTGIAPSDAGFRIVTDSATLRARRVVLATGGRSLPKTGSDGGGYALATALGHTLVSLTPALVPLVLSGEFHVPLSGISQDVEVAVRVENSNPVRIRGAMLWTHFGVSGPSVLDASRHWHRARLDGRAVEVTASFLPGEDFPAIERGLLASSVGPESRGVAQSKSTVRKTLSHMLPARVADAVLGQLDIEGTIPLSHLPRDHRRKLAHSLIRWRLPVSDSRGYRYAEVTAGGVRLTEVDVSTLASRQCPDLFLVGEILDVDGRLGGFNFQWAWSTAHVAASAISRT